MYILAIETTGAYASVALLQSGDPDAKAGGARILSVVHGNDRFSHLQNLTPQIRQVLQENELSIGDMTGIAVSHGPGSFTGIRIGVSTARALSQVTGVPCVPVSSLEALALRAAEPGFCREPEGSCPADGNEAGADPSKPAGRILICPILDARRKQVYGAAYELIDGEPVCRIEEASCLMTEFLEKLERYLEEAGRAGHAERAEAAGNTGDTEYAEIADEPGGVREILFIGDGIDTCGEIIEQWAAGPATEADPTAGPASEAEADQAAGAMESVPAGEGNADFRIPRIRYAAKDHRYQDASTVALRGAQLYRKGAGCGYMELEPEYLRMAEAEKKLRDRQAAKAAAADTPRGGADRPASPDQPASPELPTSIGQTAGAGSR